MPRGSYWKKKNSNKIFSWLATFVFERKFFVFLTRIFRRGCQNWNLCASEFFFRQQKILKKYILSQSFSVFRRKFSRFESRNFSQVYQFCIQFVGRKFSRESIAETNSFSLFFLDFYAFHFFVNLRRLLLAVLSQLNSTFPQDCLHGKPFHLKRNFKLYFNL